MRTGTDARATFVAALVGGVGGAAVVTVLSGTTPSMVVGAAGVLLASGVLLGWLTADGPTRLGVERSSAATPVRTDGGSASDIEMVVAIVRPGKLTDVKRALADVGAPSLTVTNVSGRGSQPQKTGEWHGEEYVVDLHQKIKVECVVADVPAERVAEAIREAAHTGEPGDGKVFVLPVRDALQVRTGTRGTDAV